MAQAQEMGGSTVITGISWHRSGSYPHSSLFEGVEVRMGEAAGPVLGDVFDRNFVPGTSVTVFQEDSLWLAEPEGWVEIELETTFEYRAGTDLLIEVVHTTAQPGFFTWHWDTGENRGLLGYGPDPERGYLCTDIPHLVLYCSQGGLETGSFGWIKASFR